MQITKKRLFVSVLTLIVVVVGVWYYQTKIRVSLYPLAAGETVTSWSLQNVYATDPDLQRNNTEEITRLKGLLGTGTYSDYTLFVSLASDYANQGDGQQAYYWLSRAVTADPNTGLAWNNLGDILTRVGALKTAKAAYARAVAAQPNIMSYHLGQIQFLTKYFPTDAADINAAIDLALSVTQSSNVYQLKAAWLTSIGSTTEAIAAWREVRALVSPAGRSAIDAQIAHLRAQQ